MSIIGIIAVIAAIFGVIAVVCAYFKKKADEINDKLDFDGELYYEDDDYFDSSSPYASGDSVVDEDAQPEKPADPSADDVDEEDEGKE